MAGTSIFKDKDLFIKVGRVKGIDIQSANSVKDTINIGGITKLGEAYYWDKVPINLISFGKVKDYGVWIEYNGVEDIFILSHENFEDLIFSRGTDNLYLCKVNVGSNGELSQYREFIMNVVKHKRKVKFNLDAVMTDVDKIVMESKSINVVSVREKMSKYTKAEVKRAERARELQWKLGVVTTAQLGKQLRYSKIENAECSMADINIADDIWGNDLANMKGKSTSKKNLPIHPDTKVEGTRELQTAYADIMFCFGKPYLLIVIEPIDLVMVSRLRNRSEPELFKATVKLLGRPMNSGLVIKTMYFDREAGILSEEFQSKLHKYKGINAMDHTQVSKELFQFMNKNRGVDVENTGSTSGIDIIERRIRTVKERCRGIYSVLPYELPIAMEDALVMYSVIRINSEIKSTGYDNKSPRERLNGRTNSKSWIRHGFGDYVQVFSDNNDDVDYNSVKKVRSIGALSMYPVDNKMGTWAYLKLSNNQVIYRNRAINIPISDDVINHVNNNRTTKFIDIEANIEVSEERARSDDMNMIVPGVIDEEVIVNESSDDLDSDVNNMNWSDTNDSVDQPYIDDTLINDDTLGSVGVSLDGNLYAEVQKLWLTVLCIQSLVSKESMMNIKNILIVKRYS